MGLKKFYGCKKRIRPPKAAENFWPFFWCKIKISVGKYIFLTSREVKFQSFTDVRFGPFSNLAGVSFRENWNPTGVRFGDFFFGNFVEEGNKKTTPTP